MKLFTAFVFAILILFHGKLHASRFETEIKNSVKNDTSFIYLKEFGLQNNVNTNSIEFINLALKSIKGDNPKVLVFEKGTYYFFPKGCAERNYFESNTSDVNPRKCAFLFEEIKNLTIEGNGSTLIFSEQMQPFTFSNCKNILLRNVNIDWENPLIAQGEIIKVNDEYIELKINKNESPYIIENEKLFFVNGEKLKSRWKGTMEFDKEGRFVVPETGDWGCLGSGWQNYRAENVLPGVVRLKYQFARKPALGNFLVLRHAERIHSGIFIQESKNITVKNVNLYHATGLGILAQFSEDLIFDEYRAIPNPEKNRYFGGGDDGLQVSNCKGLISVKNCVFAGLMDDPINVHGTSVKIIEKISHKQLKCQFMHHQSIGMKWGHPGDKISFVENRKMNSIATGEVEKFEWLDKETFVLTFKKSIPEELELEDALENLTWSPNLHISNCAFKSCRARGLLVSTPGKVIIENNTFESSGSAILIAGDANGWFESGAVTDILIQNNIFDELCNSSSYQFCEGIISVFPIIPDLDENTLPFHKNIRIENNQFFPFDFPVLYAKSVDGISFKNNTIIRSHRFEPYHSRKFTFTYEFCKNVRISGNSFSEDLLGKNILLKGTAKNELKLNSDLHFEVNHEK